MAKKATGVKLKGKYGTTYRGPKLFDGVFKYPRTADVDPVQAARAQALADYNYTVNSRGGPRQQADMVRIYGEAYTAEFERLKMAKYGVIRNSK